MKINFVTHRQFPSQHICIIILYLSWLCPEIYAFFCLFMCTDEFYALCNATTSHTKYLCSSIYSPAEKGHSKFKSLWHAIPMLRTIICRHAQKHRFPIITFKTHRAAPKCISFPASFHLWKSDLLPWKNKECKCCCKTRCCPPPPCFLPSAVTPVF